MDLDPRPPLRRLAAARIDDLVLRGYRTLSRRRAPDPALDRATLRGFRRLVDRALRDGAESARVDRVAATAFRALADADLAGRRQAPAVRRAVVDQFHRLFYHSSGQTWQTRASSASRSGRARWTCGSIRS